MQSIIRNAFRSAIILSVLSAAGYGQFAPEKEFSQTASRIAKLTGNSYRLVRLGIDKTPAILSASSTPGKAALSESVRNDIVAVGNFAKSEALFVAANALALPESAELVERGTAKTGNLWLSSYSASYGSIPLRERYLRINIGAISGEVMLIRNNIPSKQPNTLLPVIAEDAIISHTVNLIGIHSEMKMLPTLVFVDQPGNPSLLLCYEVTVKDPDMNELWRLTFDATTGNLVEKKSLLENECFSGFGTTSDSPSTTDAIRLVQPEIPSAGASGKILAKVHLHTPFDTLTTVGLPYALLTVNGATVFTDSNGFWSLSSASLPVTITTSFDGKFFTVLRQDGSANSTVTTSSPNVLWDDSNSDPSERDAFYSASFAHHADKTVDPKLTNIDSHMKVNVNIGSTCNAFYTPDDTSINFFSAGGGCSNTGQIADVVFHEYGHRVTNARYQQASGQNANIA
ncbi:MAG: hypothetical protein ACHQM6_05340, partial [Candidatus Kapaibacterium sp.]